MCVFAPRHIFLKLLEDAGFSVGYMALVPRITALPGSLVPWLRTFFLGNFLNLIPPQNRDENPGMISMRV